ncbi:MAG TPA: hypothetical protein VMX75_12050 [Spirochaetia bacterium]|nr:hypothetical protein [Spirochaetia bacterium]
MPDLKIIAVSGVLPTDSESLIQLIRQFGVTEIFSKPVNFPDLFATINSLLEV